MVAAFDLRSNFVRSVGSSPTSGTYTKKQTPLSLFFCWFYYSIRSLLISSRACSPWSVMTWRVGIARERIFFFNSERSSPRFRVTKSSAAFSLSTGNTEIQSVAPLPRFVRIVRVTVISAVRFPSRSKNIEASRVIAVANFSLWSLILFKLLANCF